MSKNYPDIKGMLPEVKEIDVYSTRSQVANLQCADCQNNIKLGLPCHISSYSKGFVCTPCLVKLKELHETI